MIRTIPELDALIEATKTTLYALYAERRQLQEAAKPHRGLMGKALRALVVADFQAGVSEQDIAKKYAVAKTTVRQHIKNHAYETAHDAITEATPEPPQPRRYSDGGIWDIDSKNRWDEWRKEWWQWRDEIHPKVAALKQQILKNNLNPL